MKPADEEGGRGDRGDPSAWQSLIRDLERAEDDLVADFLEEFHRLAPYPPNSVPAEDLLETAHQTFQVMVARLAGREVPFVDLGSAKRLGARRARQGVPLDALTEAVRLDLRILWRRLRSLAGPSHSPVLADHLELLIAVIDDHVCDVHSSYLREFAALQHDARIAIERDLSRLFGSTKPSAALVQRVADGVGIAPDMAIAVAVFGGEHVEVASAVATAKLPMGRMLSHDFPDALCLAWPEDQPDGGDALLPIPGVLMSASNLADVPRAARAAREVLGIVPDPVGLCGLSVLWPMIAASRLDSLVPGFTAAALAPLDTISEYERDRVVTTVRTYLENGSVNETARLSFCHRNTVVNRLAVFRDRTGLNLSVPADAAAAYLALSVHQA